MRESDVQAVGQILNHEWLEMMAREGLAPVEMETVGEDGDPPCPACGTAAPLIQGACSDCGLQLA